MGVTEENLDKEIVAAVKAVVEKAPDDGVVKSLTEIGVNGAEKFYEHVLVLVDNEEEHAASLEASSEIENIDEQTVALLELVSTWEIEADAVYGLLAGVMALTEKLPTELRYQAGLVYLSRFAPIKFWKSRKGIELIAVLEIENGFGDIAKASSSEEQKMKAEDLLMTKSTKERVNQLVISESLKRVKSEIKMSGPGALEAIPRKRNETAEEKKERYKEGQRERYQAYLMKIMKKRSKLIYPGEDAKEKMTRLGVFARRTVLKQAFGIDIPGSGALWGAGLLLDYAGKDGLTVYELLDDLDKARFRVEHDTKTDDFGRQESTSEIIRLRVSNEDINGEIDLHGEAFNERLDEFERNLLQTPVGRDLIAFYLSNPREGEIHLPRAMIRDIEFWRSADGWEFLNQIYFNRTDSALAGYDYVMDEIIAYCEVADRQDDLEYFTIQRSFDKLAVEFNKSAPEGPGTDPLSWIRSEVNLYLARESEIREHLDSDVLTDRRSKITSVNKFVEVTGYTSNDRHNKILQDIKYFGRETVLSWILKGYGDTEVYSDTRRYDIAMDAFKIANELYKDTYPTEAQALFAKASIPGIGDLSEVATVLGGVNIPEGYDGNIITVIMMAYIDYGMMDKARKDLLAGFNALKYESLPKVQKEKADKMMGAHLHELSQYGFKLTDDLQAVREHGVWAGLLHLSTRDIKMFIRVSPEGIKVDNPFKTMGDKKDGSNDRENGGGPDSATLTWSELSSAIYEVDYTFLSDLKLRILSASSIFSKKAFDIYRKQVKEATGIVIVKPGGRDSIAIEFPPTKYPHLFINVIKKMARTYTSMGPRNSQEFLKSLMKG
jgi:hypothetical protein